MVALPENVRLKVWRGLMRKWSSLLETVDVSKAELKSAIDEADAYADAEASHFNSHLPDAFRLNATQPQKALLLATVILARYDPALLESILGSVD